MKSMDDEIALNTKVSSIVNELVGTPYQLIIVEGKIVLPETLRHKSTKPNSSQTSPLLEPDYGVDSNSESATSDKEAPESSNCKSS